MDETFRHTIESTQKGTDVLGHLASWNQPVFIYKAQKKKIIWHSIIVYFGLWIVLFFKVM